MPSGKRETERKGNALVNTGPSPSNDGRTINTVEEADEPAREGGPLHNLYRCSLYARTDESAAWNATAANSVEQFSSGLSYARLLVTTTPFHDISGAFAPQLLSIIGRNGVLFVPVASLAAFLTHSTRLDGVLILYIGRSITIRLTSIIRHKGPFIRYGSLCYVMGCDPFSEGRYSVRLLWKPDAALSVANELKTVAHICSEVKKKDFYHFEQLIIIWKSLRSGGGRSGNPSFWQVPLLPSSSAESDRSEMRSKYIHVVATMKKVKMLLATASLKLHVSPAAVELLGRWFNGNIELAGDIRSGYRQRFKDKEYEELQLRITALTTEYDGGRRTMEQFLRAVAGAQSGPYRPVGVDKGLGVEWGR
ncbi:hypothetical protein T08_964 [Trichinella sp. T8]|nr:hypothetical protein T08_964 [Trichinella sp. T8]